MDPLTLQASLDALSAVAGYVKEAARAAGLDADSAYRLRLAVDEIATNIVLHGYDGAEGPCHITLSASVADGVVTIAIEDRGVAFDPRAHAGPSPEELARPLVERDEGGLGIYLALQGLDGFNYERVGEVNRNVLTVRRAGSSGGR